MVRKTEALHIGFKHCTKRKALLKGLEKINCHQHALLKYHLKERERGLGPLQKFSTLMVRTNFMETEMKRMK